MSLWQLINDDGTPQDTLFDDGIWARPGEEGFNTDAVKSTGRLYNYVGRTPDAAPDEPDA